MPELPEVETVCRGLKLHVETYLITGVEVRQAQLRYPVDALLLRQKLLNQTIMRLSRRAKYIIFEFENGFLLIHLGMTGVLRALPRGSPWNKHDHVEFALADKVIRYADSRRFGMILWSDSLEGHPLLQHLGPEPLTSLFNAKAFSLKLAKTARPIKLVLMDQRFVVGVGNIYANEALFHARIHPQKPAKLLTQREVVRLTVAIKKILAEAIDLGGSSIKDFLNIKGKPGYFSKRHAVYGRKQKPCLHCKNPISKIILGQRATYFCPHCQRGESVE